ncbi:unnamed protein product [Rhizophagus irregularis]|nr:unnamed protein product [Rhizophagus irregularis]
MKYGYLLLLLYSYPSWRLRRPSVGREGRSIKRENGTALEARDQFDENKLVTSGRSPQEFKKSWAYSDGRTVLQARSSMTNNCRTSWTHRDG